jgi:hypothetical protein
MQEASMAISISILVLGSQLIVPVADRLPKFDIARSCRLDAAAAAGLSLDQTIKRCISDEQVAQQQLGGQWSTFPVPSKASCTSQEGVGGTPSYVSLLTCLQLGQWVK